MEEYENPHLVDLFDEDGEKTTFEHLDTIEYGDNTYIVLIPYDEEEEEVSDVVIMQVEQEREEDDCLVQVLDEEVMDAVYEIFKERNADQFDFE